jgi:serine/threonine-protein kinase HipA
MESFASVAGTSEFGVRVGHEDHCNLILRYSSAPAEDLVEYLRRDILNVCLGNTDNHARNHAFLKRSGGEVRLSPLYDFAPMYLSDEGYARMARWGDDKEVRAQPDWTSVGKYVASFDDGPEASTIADMFDFLAGMFRFVQIYAQEAGIDSDILERRKLAIEENVRLLTDAAAAVLNP